MEKLICIVCPKGCHLQVNVENDYEVKGNACNRGAIYAKKELTNPTRVITSTVCINGAEIPRLPVKTSKDIPKKDMFEAMKLLNAIIVQAPILVGDVVIENILGTGADFVATRSLAKVE